eukprot:scaffold69923_cov24-Tisochrysis_lutea.AAC.2
MSAVSHHLPHLFSAITTAGIPLTLCAHLALLAYQSSCCAHTSHSQLTCHPKLIILLHCIPSSSQLPLHPYCTHSSPIFAPNSSFSYIAFPAYHSSHCTCIALTAHPFPLPAHGTLTLHAAFHSSHCTHISLTAQSYCTHSSHGTCIALLAHSFSTPGHHPLTLQSHHSFHCTYIAVTPHSHFTPCSSYFTLHS